MGDSRHVANQRNVWRVVCSEPDYCKVGSKTVPFDSFATIDNKVRAARNVIAQQQPIYRMGDVHQGVQANAGKGTPSGTSLDQGCVRFTSGHDNVKANGVPVVCHDSACLINCNTAGAGGARGTVVTEQIGVAGKAAPASAVVQKPNAELQALLDKAADKRSLWEKTRDGASGLWDGAKNLAQASLDSPGQAGIGVLKGLGNLPTDLWNLAVLGSKYTGPLSPAVQSQMMNQAALQAYQGGNTALANQLTSKASEMMSSGYVSDMFTASNAAQQGGMIGSMLVPVGAVVKGASAVAKVAKGTKAMDTAADAAKISKVVDAEKSAGVAESASGVHVKKLSSGYKLYNSEKPVYRGDGREPDEIFKNGFSSKGSDTDLVKFQRENNDSIFISTSTSESVGKDFAEMQGAGSYVYKIDPRGLTAVDVNASIGNPSGLAHEFEMAVVNKIPSSNIISARELMSNGSLGPIIPNPAYK